jgi:hypothetical protein
MIEQFLWTTNRQELRFPVEYLQQLSDNMWLCGTDPFPTPAQMRASRGDHYGLELREADEVHAEKLVKAELRRRHWPEGELARRRKGDPQKVEIAWRLRRETPMTLKWIAARLHMGVWTSVSNALARKRSKDQKCQ